MPHMVEAADAIAEYVARGRRAYDADSAVRDAILSRIVVIGEAATAVVRRDRAFASDLSEVEWSALARMREGITHRCWAVDSQIVWDTAVEEIPRCGRSSPGRSGVWRDRVDGRCYDRKRQYGSATGHSTQQDPIGIAGGLNLYGFANGDPKNFSDPFGLCTPWPDCMFQAAANWGAARGGMLGGAALNLAATGNAASEAFGTNDLGRAVGEGDATGIGLAAAGFLPVGKLGKAGRLLRNIDGGVVAPVSWSGAAWGFKQRLGWE